MVNQEVGCGYREKKKIAWRSTPDPVRVAGGTGGASPPSYAHLAGGGVGQPSFARVFLFPVIFAVWFCFFFVVFLTCFVIPFRHFLLFNFPYICSSYFYVLSFVDFLLDSFFFSIPFYDLESFWYFHVSNLFYFLFLSF